MSDIYDQHKAAFSNVSAYVVLKDGERVATITFKYPRDGAGRLYAYVHWIGTEMVRGVAGGYGYDKQSAALAKAARKMDDAWTDVGSDKADNARNFVMALATDDHWSWCHRLRDAGFEVLQAV